MCYLHLLNWEKELEFWITLRIFRKIYMPTEKQLAALAAGRAKLARLAAAAGMTPQRYARTHRRQITLGEAQRAFEKFYNPSTQITRGPRKGQPRFKSPRGVKMAKTYDQNHTSRTVTD